MVGTILTEWCRSHQNRWPKNIIYYRDGVSKAEFSKIQDREVDKIKKVANDMAPGIKLTAIIVTKRHHTRFYPAKTEDEMSKQPLNQNCKPGTLVDSVVTNPYFVDFFLQSHIGIIGTARPARYDVIRNETGHTTQALQDLVGFL
jgi:eukaryotic translation initiation factor 2C